MECARILPSGNVGDDWNFWWAEKFENYRCLPTKIEKAVEFGCGPYTNIRIIGLGRHIERIYCSDPLVRQYVTFRPRWLAEAWRNGQVLLDDHPLEECSFPSSHFDLVVLINVLDHVRDAVLCLKQVTRVTRFGGHLVVGQDLSNSEDAERTKGDIGHPIKIGYDTLDEALAPHFEQVFFRLLSREEGRNPYGHYGTYLFIGKKSRQVR